MRAAGIIFVSAAPVKVLIPDCDIQLSISNVAAAAKSVVSLISITSCEVERAVLASVIFRAAATAVSTAAESVMSTLARAAASSLEIVVSS